MLKFFILSISILIMESFYMSAQKKNISDKDDTIFHDSPVDD